MRLVDRHGEGRLERQLDPLEGGVARMGLGSVGVAHWTDHELLALAGPRQQLDDDRLLVELGDDAPRAVHEPFLDRQVLRAHHYGPHLQLELVWREIASRLRVDHLDVHVHSRMSLREVAQGPDLQRLVEGVVDDTLARQLLRDPAVEAIDSLVLRAEYGVLAEDGGV